MKNSLTNLILTQNIIELRILPFHCIYKRHVSWFHVLLRFIIHSFILFICLFICLDKFMYNIYIGTSEGQKWVFEPQELEATGSEKPSCGCRDLKYVFWKIPKDFQQLSYLFSPSGVI